MAAENSDLTRKRISKWVMNAQAVDEHPVWVEKRLALDFGVHTYIIGNGQVFQCAHCGHYDPEWSVQEVLDFFESNFGIKPYEIEVTCSVAMVRK